MADILRGLISRGAGFIFPWVVPSAIGLGVLSLFVLPRISHVPIAKDIFALTPLQQGLLFAFSTAVVGLLLNAFDTRLYRFLEGYLFWPRRIQDARVSHHRRRKAEIAKGADAARGWRQGLLYESLARYPVDDAEIAPTKLGNAIRAFETYGTDRFNLDSQTFWSELFASVPDSLRTEYEQSRASVDFFISLFYLAGFAALSSATVAILAAEFGLFLLSAVSVLLMPAFYRLAWQASSYWSQTTKAIVNVGRKGLADAFALALPATLQDERRMWGVLNAFVFYPFDAEWAAKLDEFRAKDRVTADAKKEGGEGSI